MPSRTLAHRAPNPVDLGLKAVKVAPVLPMTNAQRLKRGLSPNRPHFHRSARSLAARASAVANVNPGCITRTGTLLVSGAGIPAGTVVSRLPNRFGEYGVTVDAADALRVEYADCGETDPMNLVTLNGIADFTFLGGISGYASNSPNLAVGSASYAYLGGVIPTTPGSPPESAANSFTFATGRQEDVESAIWHVNSASGTVTAQWVNTDGRLPATSIVYYEVEDFLLLTGDAAAFETQYGSSSVATVTFVSS
ncbi:hypothetical protein C8Q72DRAFT_982136 [Fomitopsis betulina]|nr:hypothetical protein C8Q72DRAFT_982136 [Fomitopsis betulina]